MEKFRKQREIENYNEIKLNILFFGDIAKGSYESRQIEFLTFFNQDYL